MRRRAIELGTISVALVALVAILYNATFVDRQPPTVVRVSLSAAANGDDHVGQTLTAIDVEFSKQVRQTSAESRFRIDPYVAGTYSWDGQTTLIFTPSRKLPSDTAFTVTVEPGFEDLVGNVAPSGVDAWTFRTVGPPTAVSSTPADGTVDVPVDVPVTLTFDRLMDTTSVEGALRVDPALPFHANWSGRTVTLAFDGPLAYGTDYTVTVLATAADTDGSRLRTPFSLRFSTVAAGLGVVATIPSVDVSGASIRTPIAVVFDAPIDPASIAGALRITPDVAGDLRVADLPDDTAVPPGPASPSPGAGGRVLLFTPAGSLAPHTTYSVTLAPVVRRLGAAAGVAEGRTWTFTTGGPTLSAQNQIAYLSARGGVRNVWLMNPDGTNPRQLTAELAPVSGFDVTPDGGTIVYAAGGPVRIMGIDGSTLRTLTQPGRLEYAPIVTPDGRSVIVARRDALGVDEGYWIEPIPGLGDGPERQLLPAGAPPAGSIGLVGEGIVGGTGLPVWSPRGDVSDDGRRLLLVTGDGRTVLVDLATESPASPLTLDLVASAGPTWDAAAGAFLLVGAAPGNTVPSLWRVTTTGVRTRLGAADGTVAVAPNGGIATLVGGPADPRHAAYGSRALVAPNPLTTAADLSDRDPSFSPDGSTILFMRVPVGLPDHSAGIWTVGPGGRELRQLTTDGAYPRWLP